MEHKTTELQRNNYSKQYDNQKLYNFDDIINAIFEFTTLFQTAVASSEFALANISYVIEDLKYTMIKKNYFAVTYILHSISTWKDYYDIKMEDGTISYKRAYGRLSIQPSFLYECMIDYVRSSTLVKKRIRRGTWYVNQGNTTWQDFNFYCGG